MLPSSQVLVMMTGSGTISPNYNGQALTIGTTYTMTAKPASGYLFQGWLGTVTTTNTTMEFVMEPNMVLVAKFVPTPFMAAKGTYNGLFFVVNTNTEPVTYSPPDFIPVYVATNQISVGTCGMLGNVVISSKGAYSGKLLLNGKRYPVSGQFDAFGNSARNIPRTPQDGGPIVVALNWIFSDPPEVHGTVSGSNGADWAAKLVADRGAGTLPSAQYTLLIPADRNNSPPDASPGGDGYALITRKRGTAKLIGALADGAAFTQTATVSQDGYVPIYASLYSGKGLLAGWINLDFTNTDRTCLVWIHPPSSTGPYTNAFVNLPDRDQIRVSQWTKSSASVFTAKYLCLLGTVYDFDPSFNCPVAFAPNFQFSGTFESATVSGSINPTTGLMKVSIAGGTNTFKGCGAFDLGSTTGCGYLFLTSTAGQTFSCTFVLRP